MATGTNLEQDLQNANARAAQCRWIGDYDGALYWEHEAQTYSDRIVMLENHRRWDVLKGASRG